MSRAVVLLRAVNVGGRNKLPMADLRQALTGAGFEAVSTYIQSGNVLLEPGRRDDRAVEAEVAEVIARQFGLEIAVMARTVPELQRCLERHPFAADGVAGSALHVAFLEQEPTPEQIAALDPDRFLPDRFAVVGREVYLHYPDGSGNSKLTGAWLERSLGGLRGTARNLNTVEKLIALASS